MCLELLARLATLDAAGLPPAAILKAEKLAEAFKTGFAATKCPLLKGRLAVEMVACCGVLAAAGKAGDSSWKKLHQQLLEDEAVMEAVSAVLRLVNPLVSSSS